MKLLTEDVKAWARWTFAAWVVSVAVLEVIAYYAPAVRNDNDQRLDRRPR
jgi:hypothetical protein